MLGDVENTNKLMHGANPRDAWAAFIGLLTAVKTTFATISSLMMLSAFSSSVSRRDLGVAIFLAAVWPTMRSLLRRQLDSKSCNLLSYHRPAF